MESYYTQSSGGDNLRAGRWAGAMAERLGLEGQDVEGDVMRSIFGDMVAPDGTKLGQAPSAGGVFRPVDEQVAEWAAAHPDARPEDIKVARKAIERKARDANLGVDLTASPSKSVTVVWTAMTFAHNEAARANGRAGASPAGGVAGEYAEVRDAIQGSHDRANDAMLARFYKIAGTRSGRHGGVGTAGRFERAAGVLVASFAQSQSRAIQPQLHTHNAALNKVLCADGQYRALDTDDLFHRQVELAAVYERWWVEEMAQSFDMELRLDGRKVPAWEVKGVDRKMVEFFSERTVTVRGKLKVAVAEQEKILGRELTQTELYWLKQDLTLRTRNRKTSQGETPESVARRMDASLRGQLQAGLRPVAARYLAAYRQRGDRVREPARFDPAAVIDEAIAQAAAKNPAWNRSDLFLEIHRVLPVLHCSPAAAVETIDRLTDQALSDPARVMQVAGRDLYATPAELGGPGTYVQASEVKYAAVGSVEAEKALRRAAAGVGRHRVSAAAAGRFLDQHYPSLGADQRQAVIGMAAAGSGVAQMIGPAGTGKSYAVKAYAHMWRELSGGGRVIGLAPSSRAAQVLQDEGVEITANTAAFLAAQRRMQRKRGLPTDAKFRLSDRDVVLVDEASMASMRHVTQLRELVDRKGSQIRCVGDPSQLGAVEAGGALGLLEGYAPTWTLTEVRRFVEPWEGPASLRLRDRDVDVLDEYDRRGRIIDCDTLEQAIDEAAFRSVAARLDTTPVVMADGRVSPRPDGRDSIIPVGTNQEAAAASEAVRERLIDAGIVRPELGEVLLSEHGGVASVGDHIACRENDRRLDVTNRRLYTVRGVLEGGGLDVECHETRELRRLTPDYVSKNVSLGYAGTGQAVEGITVDHNFPLTTGNIDGASVYVLSTRGRVENTWFVARQVADDDPSKARTVEQFRTAEGESKARVHEFDKSKERPSGRKVLEDSLRRSAEDRDAALVQLERDDARLRSMSTIHGLREDAVRQVCADRTTRWLEELGTAGVLEPEVVKSLGSDKATEGLSRLLRTVEQAGHDPQALLRHAAVDARGMDGLRSYAAGLSKRISKTFEQSTGQRPEAATPTVVGDVPAGSSPAMAAYLGRLQEATENRRRELGTQVAEELPTWAVTRLGPVPEDPTARLEWEHKAGIVAGYRESRGWTDDVRAINESPGIFSTERRAGWHEAFDALGCPEDEREEAGLSDGALRVRVRAFEREQMWAPANADEALKANSIAAGRAEAEASMARHDGREVEPPADGVDRRAVVGGLQTPVEARDTYNDHTATFREKRDRALQELRRRHGEDLEAKQLTADEYLDRCRLADAASSGLEDDDHHRPVLEPDVDDTDRRDAFTADVEERSGDLAMVDTPGPVEVEGANQATVPADVTPEQLGEVHDRAVQVLDRIADRESVEATADDVWEEPPVPEPEVEQAPVAELPTA